MPKYSRFTKALTLFSFTFLISAFLLYRSGNFDTYFSANGASLQTSHYGGTIKAAMLDSVLHVAMDSSERLMLYSSKSMVLLKPRVNYYDSIKKKKKVQELPTPPVMMSSSKSGMIFTPKETKLFIDTTRFDIKKFKRLKN
ncbi:hypothetical protein [Ferruginibacter profundus]